MEKIQNDKDLFKQVLEACPFCGNEPSFSGDASEWKDESRYVELSLGCCVSMTEQIGWRRARDMTHEAKTAELRSRLQLRWNTRAALAQPVQEPVQQALCEADRIMGHDDEATEWRERWGHLFKAPPQRKPLTDKCICNHTPLTDDQLDDIAVAARRGNLYDLRIAIERALKIGGKE